MKDQEFRFRNKIIFIQFLLSVGIVYLHTQWNYNDNLELNFVHNFLVYLMETCVPFFFMISGYLFFRTFDLKNAKKKILSRGKTLLIPYLIWNVIYAIFMISLTNLGYIKNAFISSHVGGVLLQLINAEFSPLWFVKYLMIFTLISPLMYFLLRRKIIGVVSIIIMLGLNAISYYFGWMQIPINVNANNLIMLNYQYIFYAVGAYCALNWKEGVEKSSYKKTVSAFGMLLFLVIMYFSFIVYHNDVIINHLFRILYVCSLWFAVDVIANFKIWSWMGCSFFLYCSHLMVLQSTQKVCDIIINKMGDFQATLYILEYIFLPMIVIVLLLVVAEKMKKRFPRVWSILTGGRR